MARLSQDHDELKKMQGSVPLAADKKQQMGLYNKANRATHCARGADGKLETIHSMKELPDDPDKDGGSEPDVDTAYGQKEKRGKKGKRGEKRGESAAKGALKTGTELDGRSCHDNRGMAVSCRCLPTTPKRSQALGLEMRWCSPEMM